MNIFVNRHVWQRDIKAELDLSSYVIKAELQNATRVDTSKFA